MQHSPLVLIHFTTEWNGASQILAMICSDLAGYYRNRVTFLTSDLEKEAALAQQYGIREAPTILFLQDGQIIDYTVGLIPRNALISKIESALQISN
jgi:thioredoxin 1